MMQLQFANTILRPLQESDFEALAALAQDERIWQNQFWPILDVPTFKTKWFDKAIQAQTAGERISLLIIDKDKLVGSSSFYDIDRDHKRATIGYTWFHPAIWGSSINAVSKLLMLDYAFNELELHRIAFTVDSGNIRSCKALEKLGATFEGILRNHMIRADGSQRHTASYSFIKEEWSEKRERILKQIAERSE